MESSLAERARVGGYREYAPPADLLGRVAAVWTYSRPADSNGREWTSHRLLPDPDVSIVVLSRLGHDGAVIDRSVCLRGPIGRMSRFSPAAGVRIDAVRLRPEWCQELIGVDPREHVDEVRPLGDTTRPLAALCDHLAATNASPLRILTEAIRARQFASTFSRNTLRACAALESARRSTPIEFVARECGVSERQLRRIVLAVAGVSPKYVQRVSRVHRAIAAADKVDVPNWARIAVHAGFYDQAHMIAQYQAVAGCTPAALDQERRRETQMSEISNHC